MSNDIQNAHPLRRLAAMFYDALLVVALWIISTLLLVIPFGEAVGGPLYQLFLYFEALIFFTMFWRIRGQTLGMQVWKIRVLDRDGYIMSHSQCMIRFLIATLSLAAGGLGFLWMFFNRERLTWHDMASDSRVVFLGKDPYRK